MKFTLTIETDNDAFRGDPAWEIKRLLLRTIEQIDNGRFDQMPDEGDVRIVDINGNTVGRWRMSK